MLKIGVTGTSGDVVKYISGYLKQFDEYSIENFSLRGDTWKKRKLDYDVVVHLVGVVPGKEKTPNEFHAINTDLTVELVKKAKSDGVQQVIYLSSMSVYGFGPRVKGDFLVGEETKLMPINEYGKSKLNAENQILPLNDNRFHVAVIRVPSIYYPGNIDFLSVAEDMLLRFRAIPVAYVKKFRNCIFIENLCELIRLIIANDDYGVVCAQDEPQCSLFDYMNLLARYKYFESGFRKSKLLGVLVKIIIVAKPSWKAIFGGIAFNDNTTLMYDGRYRLSSTKEALARCIKNG